MLGTKILIITILLAQSPLQRGNGTGAVTGRIVSVDGTPAAELRVAAAVVGNKVRTSAEELASLTLTDVEGRYRLENLPPGLYRIAAGQIDDPTYFPGVTANAGATIVTVVSGSVLSNIDFKMAVPKLQNVSGRILRSATSRNAMVVVVKLTGAKGATEVTANFSTPGADGLFEFKKVEPGAYTVTISAGGISMPLAINVVDKAVTGLQLGIPLVDVSGTVNLAQGSRQLFVLNFTNTMPGAPGTSALAIGPTFTVGVPPGEYRLAVGRMPPGYEIESITAGSRDLRLETFQVTSPETPQIHVVLRPAGQPR